MSSNNDNNNKDFEISIELEYTYQYGKDKLLGNGKHTINLTNQKFTQEQAKELIKNKLKKYYEDVCNIQIISKNVIPN
jgi:ribosomal protein L15